MTDPVLRGLRILVVEDNFFLARVLRTELGEAGATVIGPVGTVADALARVRAEPAIDCALLDINLHGEMAFPVADALTERGVPFLFTTGYDASIVVPRFAHIIRCEKPVHMSQVVRAIDRAIRGAPASQTAHG